MTPEQENAFDADPDNQVAQGSPVRRKASVSGAVRLPGEPRQDGTLLQPPQGLEGGDCERPHVGENHRTVSTSS